MGADTVEELGLDEIGAMTGTGIARASSIAKHPHTTTTLAKSANRMDTLVDAIRMLILRTYPQSDTST
jgi:hypothetical protein